VKKSLFGGFCASQGNSTPNRNQTAGKNNFPSTFFCRSSLVFVAFCLLPKGGRWAVAGGSWFVAFATRQTIAI